MKRAAKIVKHDLVRRSATFAVSTVASTVVGVVSIPLITAAVGAQQWGALAFLQVLGQFASIFIAFGWGATGPSIVSSLPPAERKQYLYESLLVRSALFLVVAPLAVLLGVLMGAEPIATTLAVVAYGIPGVGAAWYFVGTNRPALLLMCDALPAILGQIVALFFVAAWPDLRVYLAVVAAFAVLGTITGLIVAFVTASGAVSRPSARRIRSTMAVQRHGLASVLFGNIASMLPAFFVYTFANTLYPVYALADRLYRYGLIVLAPILQAVQSWVPEAGPKDAWTRARQCVVIGLSIGSIGGLGLALLSPLAASLLTHGAVEISWVLAIVAGIGFGAECVAQIVGLAGLVALRRDAVLARTAIVAAIVSVPLMVPALFAWGIVGIFVVLAASAVGVSAYRVWALLRTPAS